MDPETDRGVFSTTDHGQVEEGTKYMYFFWTENAAFRLIYFLYSTNNMNTP